MKSGISGLSRMFEESLGLRGALVRFRDILELLGPELPNT
jgi:hypothetical protein